MVNAHKPIAMLPAPKLWLDFRRFLMATGKLKATKLGYWGTAPVTAPFDWCQLGAKPGEKKPFAICAEVPGTCVVAIFNRNSLRFPTEATFACMTVCVFDATRFIFFCKQWLACECFVSFPFCCPAAFNSRPMIECLHLACQTMPVPLWFSAVSFCVGESFHSTWPLRNISIPKFSSSFSVPSYKWAFVLWV